MDSGEITKDCLSASKAYLCRIFCFVKARKICVR